MEQKPLWEDGKEASKSLIIGKRQKETLSKQQQTFNRLVKKIEKLRQELEITKSSLNDKLDFYGKQVYPVQQQLVAVRKECTRLLYGFLKNKKSFFFSKKEKSFLKEVIAVQLDAIFLFQKDEPDDEFKEIFKAVEGISYDEAAEQDFSSLKDEMEDMFKQFGFNMNFGDMHGNMTQEELIQKMNEKQEQFRQQSAAGEQHHTTRKKTKKQLEREEREKQIEEARTKNISTIYKQLAKAFHPDLEQDAGLKMQKEELMKQLTNAYDNNDLHTLLKLELSWIQKEENNPDKLSDDKLSIYNEVLKEQVQELQDEINMLVEHPRYQSLHTLVSFPGQVMSLNLIREKANMQTMLKDISKTVAELKGTEKQALREIKDIISFFEKQNKLNTAMERLFRQ